MLFIALTFLIYRAGGVLALGVYNGARAFLPIILAPIAGRIWQKSHPLRIVFTCDVIRGLIVFLIGFLTSQSFSLWTLQSLAIIVSAVSVIAVPAQRRLHREIVESKYRNEFNSIIAASGTLVMAISASVGGFILQYSSAQVAIFFDAFTFLASASIMLYLSNFPSGISGSRERPQRKLTAGIDHLVQSPDALTRNQKKILQVVRESIIGDRLVFSLFILQFTACFIAGATLGQLAPLAEQSNLPISAIGWLASAVGAGSFFGAIAGRYFAKRYSSTQVMWCIFLMALLELTLGIFIHPIWIVIGLTFMGFLANLPEAMYWNVYMERVNDEASGVFYGMVEASIGGGFAIGAFVFGVFANEFGTLRSVQLIGILSSSLVCVIYCAFNLKDVTSKNAI